MYSLRSLSRLCPRSRSVIYTPVRKHWLSTAWDLAGNFYAQHPFACGSLLTGMGGLLARNLTKHNVKLMKEQASQQNKVTPILQRLKLPFDAHKVLPIKYGELFPRPEFEKELAMMLDDMYVIFYGPSEYGKSTAIVHHKGIRSRQGILYLSLRGARDDAASKLAAALGLPRGHLVVG